MSQRKTSHALVRGSAIVAAIALAFTLDARANMLFDGDFEGDGSHGPNDGSYAIGSTYITGWTVYARTGFYNVQWISNGSFRSIDAQAGIGLLDLTGNPDFGDAGVQQGFATTAGTSYKATFYLGYASTSQGFSGPVTAEVSTLATANSAALDDGENKQRFTTGLVAGDPSSTVWTPFEYDFTATSDTTLLRIEGISQGGVFLGLDSVDVELGPVTGPVIPPVTPPVRGTVPEPEVAGLLGLGLVAMAIGRRRRAQHRAG
jgi:hypothetical protein